MERRGAVIAPADPSALGDNGTIQQITFTVANVLGGEAVDFTEPTADSANTGRADSTSTNKVVINYIDANQTVKDLYWEAVALGTTNGNDLLEANEKFQITIGADTGDAGGDLMNALAGNLLDINTTFTLEVLTPSGAVLVIERTTPAYINQKMNLR